MKFPHLPVALTRVGEIQHLSEGEWHLGEDCNMTMKALAASPVSALRAQGCAKIHLMICRRKEFLKTVRHRVVLSCIEVHTDEQRDTLGLQIFSLGSDSWSSAFTVWSKNHDLAF